MRTFFRKIGVSVGLLSLVVSCTNTIGPPTPTYSPSAEKRNYGRSVTVTSSNQCPAMFPVVCGSWCCPSGKECDPSGPDGQKCSKPAQTLNENNNNTSNQTPPKEEPKCPPDAPIDCETFCCPTGTTCDPNGPEAQKCKSINQPKPTPCNSDSDCEATQICVINEENKTECADLCTSDSQCKGQCCWATDDPEVGACGPC